jgi:hypothetical protein
VPEPPIDLKGSIPSWVVIILAVVGTPVGIGNFVAVRNQAPEVDALQTRVTKLESTINDMIIQHNQFEREVLSALGKLDTDIKVTAAVRTAVVAEVTRRLEAVDKRLDMADRKFEEIRDAYSKHP